MKINGKLGVEKWLVDSPFEICSSVEDLNLKLTKIGAIGYYNESLYFRKNVTTVVPLISITELTQTIQNISLSPTVITNIAGDLINNEEFIENIVNSVNFISNLISNQDFINEITQLILYKLNVEVKDLGGVTLFYAFSPDAITELINRPPLPPTDSCVTPTSITLTGELHPNKGDVLEYTVNIVGGNNPAIAFSITGGTILTSPYEPTIQVEWSTTYTGLCSLNVGVGCFADTINTKYLWNFFTLGE